MLIDSTSSLKDDKNLIDTEQNVSMYADADENTEITDADLETIWNVPIISDTESENDINLPVHYTYMKRYIWDAAMQRILCMKWGT